MHEWASTLFQIFQRFISFIISILVLRKKYDEGRFDGYQVAIDISIHILRKKYDIYHSQP